MTALKRTLFLSLLLGLMACAPSTPLTSITPLSWESVEVESVRYIGTPTPPPAPTQTKAAINDTALKLVTATPTHAVPTPIVRELPRGEALAQARATDVAHQIEPEFPVDLPAAPVPLYFNEFFVNYDPYSAQAPQLSDKLMALDGQRVVMEGYMAPPLKLDLDWFMLTSAPIGACPFCSTAADWTAGLALVYVEGGEITYSYGVIRVEGELHAGSAVDPETGMVSLVRLYADERDVEFIPFP